MLGFLKSDPKNEMSTPLNFDQILTLGPKMVQSGPNRPPEGRTPSGRSDENAGFFDEVYGFDPPKYKPYPLSGIHDRF